MIDLEFIKSPVNIDKLHEDLSAAFNKVFIGVTVSADQVRIHVTDAITQAERDQIGLLVLMHDAALLTAAQQAAKDRAVLWASLQKPWDTWTPQDKDNFLRLLSATTQSVTTPLKSP